MSRCTSVLAVAAAAAALTLAGCSDSDQPGDSVADSTTPAERVVIEPRDGSFDPGAIYERAAPGVVTITSIFGGGSDSRAPFGGGGSGQGSGFVISADGEILTNAHVVTDAEASGASEINEAKELYVQFADHNQVPAEIVGFDPYADIALVKVDPKGLEIEPLELGSLDDIAVGSPVAAIGSPFGEQQSLSTGVVSATDRSIQSLTEFQIDGAIQTDASINPGNSGGPLLDADGQVIGLNQQINTTSGGNEGVGYAVPIDLAQRSLEQLRDDGQVDYAFIGVTTQSLYPQLADRLGIDSDSGALIAELTQGGPADEAGLQASDQKIRFQGQEIDAGGDVIVAVDGEELTSESDLPRLISRLDPGTEVTLEIIRDGERDEIDVTLGARADA
ncbi:MAG: trypsin-like peptidase domain-containing protein [bacterium]